MLHVLPQLVMLLAPVAAVPPSPAPSFEACDQLATTQPEGEKTAQCFSRAGDALKQTDTAMARLQELLRRHPGSLWPRFYLAYRDPNAGEELSRIADGFAAQRNAKGEVSARVNIYRLLFS